MNFKDNYMQANEELKLDAGFKSQLAEKMKQEQRAMRKRNRILISTGVAAAAAVMCLIALNVGEPSKETKMQEVQSNAEAVESSSSTGQGFGVAAWYGDARTPEEMMEAFKTLLQEEQLETLYCSDAEVFEKEDILPEEEAKGLINALDGAEITNEMPDGKCKYYMAVFANGSIVKFEIHGEQYFKFKDEDVVYSF